MNIEHQHFDCQCTELAHSLRFSVDPTDGDIWIDVHLNRLPWHKRLWIGVKYILGVNDRGIQYEETLLRHEDYQRIRDMLEWSEGTHREAQKNSTHTDDGTTISLNINCREAQALAHVVGRARYLTACSPDRESHDGVHTVYPKVMDTYERLLKVEKDKR